jgi:transcriptional regulator with XRE-family HTH domain
MGFSEWLDRELDSRGWSRSEAARRGGISASMVDKVINGHAQPGMTFYKGIAQAFEMPLEDVLIKAGEIEKRTEDTGPTFWEWLRIWLNANDEERDRLLERAEKFAAENKAAKEAEKKKSDSENAD